jgi:hypothetical protein
MIMTTSEKDFTRMLYSLIHNEEYAEAIVILQVSINIELNNDLKRCTLTLGGLQALVPFQLRKFLI